jgi:hypothetical protein
MTFQSPKDAPIKLEGSGYDIAICDSDFLEFAKELVRTPSLKVIILGEGIDTKSKVGGTWFMPMNASIEWLNDLIRQLS